MTDLGRKADVGWLNFNPRSSLVSLIFVVFEVEIALTIPVAMVLRMWVYTGQGPGADLAAAVPGDRRP